MMLSCREVSRLISQGMDEKLPWGRRARLRLHLLICDACSNFSRQVRFLRQAMSRLL